MGTATSRWGELALPGVVLLCVIATMLRYPLAVNHDNALMMSYAQRILDGQTPYVDFYEINPPLIMYLSTIPVALGRLLGQNPIPLFNLIVLGLCVWSALSIRRTMIDLELPGRALVLTAWIGLAWATQFTLSMGQREHLFALGYVPFLLLRVARWSELAIPRRRAIAVGGRGRRDGCDQAPVRRGGDRPGALRALRHRRLRPLASPEVAAAVLGCAVPVPLRRVPGDRARVPVRARTADEDRLGDRRSVGDRGESYRFAWVAIALCVAVLTRSRAARARRMTRWVASLHSPSRRSCSSTSFPKSWPYHFEPALHGSVLAIGIRGRSRQAAVGITAQGRRARGRFSAAMMFAAATQIGTGMAVFQRVPTRAGNHHRAHQTR